MSEDPPSAKPALPRRKVLGRDARLVIVTAGFTSLVWLVALVAVGPDLIGDDGTFAESSPPTVEPGKIAPRVRAAGEDFSRAVLPRPDPVPGGRGLAMRIPVLGISEADLVDTYTAARGGGSRRHDAIDIMAPTGTPVVAARAGTVEKLYLSDDGGKTIYIRTHDTKRMHYYAHLDRIEQGLTEGQTVEAGETIGTVGFSGNANPDAPHLHFAVMEMAPGEDWWEGTPINPYPLLVGR